jgi:hypothetical protein
MSSGSQASKEIDFASAKVDSRNTKPCFGRMNRAASAGKTHRVWRPAPPDFAVVTKGNSRKSPSRPFSSA